MKTFYLSLSLCFCFSISLGQTNISGIINTYRSVSNITHSGCSVCSNPACYSEITVSSSAGFTAGGIALIIQMQGAVINETNSALFGNVTATNNTGNFEYVNIISIPNATTVRVSTLVQTYSTPASPTPGVVQLINVPVYPGDVNVTAMLTAQAWNGTTGGVLAFIAGGKVLLNSNIDVSGRGFRGYAHHESSNGDCLETAYFLSSATQINQGALKGEGIAMVIANKERGRGKQANGGGGGIGHNGGGGGGGNGGAGGFGGQMYTGCPNIAGRGEGGTTFVASSTRVVMGGAGGTGDSNGTGTTDPGGDATNGGGIILIIADSLVNNNHSAGYSGTTGPANPAVAGYFANDFAQIMEFDVFCRLTLNSVVVRSQAAQTVRISLRSPDKTTELAFVSLAIPAGVSTVPLGFVIDPGRGYWLSAAGSTGSLHKGGNGSATYPYTVPDVISIKYADPNHVGSGNEIPYFFNWNVTARCASGGYKINASGIDNPAVVDADGGGGGGAGGSIFIRANGYRGIINMMATGGEGADMVNGGCHAPGGGGGGGYICMNTVPPLSVYRNVSGAAPGEIPDAQASCWTSPVTGYNSHGATRGADGVLCTGLLATAPCTLPVDFLAFTARKDGPLNLLEWSTSTEKNNEYFSVERSSDGVDFTVIGTVRAKGNSNNTEIYRFYDPQPLSGTNYYRLKQTDYDGIYSHSKTIAVVNSDTDFSIYPIPSAGRVTIRFNASGLSYKLEITDMNGRSVYSQSGNAMKEEIEVNDLARGIYTVRLVLGQESLLKKLVVY